MQSSHKNNNFPFWPLRTGNSLPTIGRRLLVTVALLMGASEFQLCYGQATPANFVPVAPCRIADTRVVYGGTGTLGGGSITTFNIGGQCGIPLTATAYSLNVAVIPTGPLAYITLFPTGQARPNASTLNDYEGTVVANAALVPAGTNGQLNIYVDAATDLIIDTNGYFTAETSSTNYNTAMGTGALSANSSGAQNTAIGYEALTGNTSGYWNTAIGWNALAPNTSGAENTALGVEALASATSVNDSTAIGAGALPYLTSGYGNIAIGFFAGSDLMAGSNNIYIGNIGATNDSGAIRIGTNGSQSSTFMAGIYGVPVTGSAVIINSNGQLGVQSSSIRFKEDVRDMSLATDALMKLRPVEFRYKQAAEDGTKPLQYGLIAEEVADVYPELVVRGKDGQPDSVQYHELPAMLLNELQKQHHKMSEEEQAIKGQQQIIQQLEQRLAALEQR